MASRTTDVSDEEQLPPSSHVDNLREGCTSAVILPACWHWAMAKKARMTQVLIADILAGLSVAGQDIFLDIELLL